MKSIYVHIPFCKQKCLYCDFNSFQNKDELIEKYIDALIGEIESYNIQELNTIYIGGGTPSYIDEKYIVRILEKLPKAGEITIEVNPGTVTKEKLKAYIESGINRLSIGLQATQNDILKSIGRIHTFEEFDYTYNLAREVGFKNINVDLMFGLPKQTFKDLKESVEYLIKINPEHISCYSLIVHGSIFENLPSEEVERKMYYHIIKTLKENGYIHYEISNFANENMESKHNMVYWNQEEYIGVGAGASSYLNDTRWTNEMDIMKYIEAPASTKYAEIEEVQTLDSKLSEYIILKLRLTKGLNLEEANRRFGIDFWDKYKDIWDKLARQGLIEINDSIYLTEKGLDLANLVWEEFV